MLAMVRKSSSAVHTVTRRCSCRVPVMLSRTTGSSRALRICTWVSHTADSSCAWSPPWHSLWALARASSDSSHSTRGEPSPHSGGFRSVHSLALLPSKLDSVRCILSTMRSERVALRYHCSTRWRDAVEQRHSFTCARDPCDTATCDHSCCAGGRSGQNTWASAPIQHTVTQRAWSASGRSGG